MSPTLVYFSDLGVALGSGGEVRLRAGWLGLTVNCLISTHASACVAASFGVFSSVVGSVCSGALAGATVLVSACGSGLVIHVEVDDAGPHPGDALPDVLLDTSSSDGALADAAQSFTQAVIMPSLTDPACLHLDVVEQLDRVTASVCFPPGALAMPRTVRLSRVTDASTTAPGPVRGLAFRVAAPDTTLRQGDSYRPIARLDYTSSAGLPANLALGQHFDDAPASALWRVLRDRVFEPARGSVHGRLEEAPTRIANGITFAPVLHCLGAEQCPTNHCAAEVCQ